MEVTFDKIQFKQVGPFNDLRFLKGDNEVATIRALGDMPGERGMIQKLFVLFYGFPVQVCTYGIADWVPVTPEPSLDSKPPRWLREKNDRADAREEFEDGRALDCAATLRELKG